MSFEGDKERALSCFLCLVAGHKRGGKGESAWSSAKGKRKKGNWKSVMKSMRTQCGFSTSHKLNINTSLQLNLKPSRQIPFKEYNMK